MAGGEGVVIEEVKDEHYKNPLGVTSDEEGPDGFVRVNIIFPGLKKKVLRNVVANGVLEPPKFETRALRVDLSLINKGSKKLEKYRYSVQRLPDDIVPEESYHKVRDGQVVLYLKKEKSRSWARELADSGIETYEEPE